MEGGSSSGSGSSDVGIPGLTLPFSHLLADPMLARPRMSVTQRVRPRQGILIGSILPLFLFTPHKTEGVVV